MRLKTFTTGLMIFGVALLCGIPFMMQRQPPKGSSERELAVYALQFGTYTLTIFAVMITAIVCALLVLRQTTRSLKEEAERNMKTFVEGSLTDHQEQDFSLKDQREESDGMKADLPVNPEDWPEEDDVPRS